MSRELPEGWSSVALGDVIRLEYGRALSASARDAGNVPVYGSNGVCGHHSAALVNERGIVVGRKGTAGSVTVTSGPFWPIDTTYFVVPRVEADFDWLAATLEHARLSELNEATGVPGLNRDKAYTQSILLPPLDEQRRIAEVLRSGHEAFLAAANASAQCLFARNAVVDELLRTGMPTQGLEATEAWSEAKLGDVLSIKHGFAFSSDFFRSDDTGTVLLTPGNFSVSKQLYFGSNTKFYDGPVPEGYTLANGDLLIVMTDLTQDMAILGNAATLDTPARVLHNQRIGKVTCDAAEIVPDFARLLLNSPAVQSRVKASASGSTVRHTSPGKILEIRVKLPPLEEQQEMIGIARSLDRSFESEAFIAAPAIRGMPRGFLKGMNASLRTDLLSGRVRVPA